MAISRDLPQLENRKEFTEAKNSEVFDDQGNKIGTLLNNNQRVLLDSDEISPYMKNAVVAIEDERFYEHRGVDLKGMFRAGLADVLPGGSTQGASTITQQFVKNALEAQGNRTVFQKFREAALAYHLERQWDKDKILTEYLNTIYFGEGAYGIEAAARTYFAWNHPGCGKSGGDPCAKALYPYEAAMLAGIITSPSAYSPRVNPQARDGPPQPRALEDEGAGLHRRGRVPGRDRQGAPGTVGHRAPAGRLGLPLLQRLAAPAGGRPLRARPGVQRRPRHPHHPRPRNAAEGRGDRRRDVERDRADRLAGGARQQDRGDQGDGRRLRLREVPLQPGDLRASPAGLGLQAVHPGDRAGARPLA